MDMPNAKIAAALLTGLFMASSSQAASVSYFLDQSNKLSDGINYLKVTIADGAEGSVNFTVEALDALLNIAGDNFGIQKFGFNVLGGIAAEAADVAGLPENWRARNGGRMDGFGLYDITLKGKGKNRQDPLTFSIDGVSVDSIMSYVDLSTGRSPQGFSLFSAKVSGFNFGNCDSGGGKDDDKKGPSGGDGGKGGKCVHSAYFGGVTEMGTIPAPPAVWLLGTAVAGLVVRRFRATKASANA
jgi:hypothetical protein